MVEIEWHVINKYKKISKDNSLALSLSDNKIENELLIITDPNNALNQVRNWISK